MFFLPNMPKNLPTAVQWKINTRLNQASWSLYRTYISQIFFTSLSHTQSSTKTEKVIHKICEYHFFTQISLENIPCKLFTPFLSTQIYLKYHQNQITQFDDDDAHGWFIFFRVLKEVEWPFRSLNFFPAWQRILRTFVVCRAPRIKRVVLINYCITLFNCLQCPNTRILKTNSK